MVNKVNALVWRIITERTKAAETTFIVKYNMIYYYFRFGGRHIEFNLDVFRNSHRSLCQRIGDPWKHSSNFWNHIASYSYNIASYML